ncbi:hypothetical protein FHT78_003250 [Rhizobium sp. BK196]|jgi:hypothetical protein|uniref:hypothetical protein n=1 Tax=Rhizobium sp. BK196 TaxID=2587073 RepID=UPI001610AC8C|nr:hypothetical protein [Rhizobium sp. BK196]MBB3311485.1 hypothetical protein [Rhizobium sp. BK196]
MVARAEAPKTDSAKASRVYKDFPGYERSAFINFLKAGGQPDDFPGLDFGPVLKTLPFRKIADFHVSREKRIDRGMIPCAMCGFKEKFLEGSLVWIEGRQTIALIGHCCADKENQRRAEEEYLERMERTRAEDFLLASLPLTKAALAAIEQALAAAVEAERIKAAFSRKFPAAVQALKGVSKSGGMLGHTEKIKDQFDEVGPRGLGRLNTHTVTIGHLFGAGALGSGFHPVKDLRVARSRVEALICEESPEAALQLITSSYASGDELKKAARLLLAAGKEYKRSLRLLQEFRSFFAEYNFSTINEWARHPLSDHRFSFEYRRLANGVRISGKEGDAFDTLHLEGSVLRAPPEWPLAPTMDAE